MAGVGKAGRLVAHHVIYLEHGGDEYDVDNLRTLCAECHSETHRKPIPDAVQRQCCPRYHLAVTDSGEPARTSHISKMVLSIVNFGGLRGVHGGVPHNVSCTTDTLI